MQRFLAAALLLLALSAFVDAGIEELSQPTATVYFSKSTEVAIMGCFEKASGAEYDAFLEIAGFFEQFGGVALGTTTTKAVWSRYLSAEDGAEAPPAVVLWTAFDPETGKIRKGKKTKLVYSGPFTYAALYKFLVRESQPLVLRLPEREGPDFQKRQQLGTSSAFPKLMFFHPKDKDASEALLQVAAERKADMLAFHFLVNNDEEDEGWNAMNSFGISYKDLGKSGSAVIFQGQSLDVFSGDVTDAAALGKFAKEFVEAHQDEFAPAPKAGAAGGKKSKKKKKKTEM